MTFGKGNHCICLLVTEASPVICNTCLKIYTVDPPYKGPPLNKGLVTIRDTLLVPV